MFPNIRKVIYAFMKTFSWYMHNLFMYKAVIKGRFSQGNISHGTIQLSLQVN